MLCETINNNIFIELIKISILFNLYKDGWYVTNIDKKSIEIKKKRMNNEDIDLNCFINRYLIRVLA